MRDGWWFLAVDVFHINTLDGEKIVDTLLAVAIAVASFSLLPPLLEYFSLCLGKIRGKRTGNK